MTVKLVSDVNLDTIRQSRSLCGVMPDCDCNCACPTESALVPVLSLPVAYYLELTPDCNNHCPGCGNVYARHRGRLPAPLDGERWNNVIDRLVAHAYLFKITGGEPTLHPDFAAIIRAVADRGRP